MTLAFFLRPIFCTLEKNVFGMVWMLLLLHLYYYTIFYYKKELYLEYGLHLY